MTSFTGQAPAPERDGNTACYVYGIVPADTANLEAHGIGEPPARVTLVPHGKIAALVSEVDIARQLGTPEDLLAHQRVLDAACDAGPVLPMRFGAMVTGAEAVAGELLEPHHDEFAGALDDLAGHVQYVVSGRYVQQAVLAEILAENPGAARLRERIVGQDEDMTRSERIQLGEIISNAIEAKRDAASAEAERVLGPFCAAIAAREPTHEYAAAHLALLVGTDRQGELVRAFDTLVHAWAGRVELRMLGPMAPYDFVSSPEMES